MSIAEVPEIYLKFAQNIIEFRFFAAKANKKNSLCFPAFVKKPINSVQLISQNLSIFRSLVVPMIENWDMLVSPIYQLCLSFKEFALFKALVCWHICKFFIFLTKIYKVTTNSCPRARKSA